MLIEDYCQPQPAVAHPGETLRRAARRMRDEDVGSLVVVERGVPVAIATDRDLAIQTLCRGLDPGTATIGEIASPTIRAIEGERPIGDALQYLRRTGFRRVPVVDERGKLQGVLAADDFILLAAGELDGIADAIRAQSPRAGDGRTPRKAAGTRFLRRDVATLPQECGVLDAARVMKRRGVGSLIVLANERPVGIVTDRDLLQRVIAEGGHTESAAVAEIMSAPLRVAGRETPFDQIVALMATYGIRRVPIVEDEELLGIVALDDVLRAISDDLRDLCTGIERGLVDGRRGGRARGLVDEMKEDLGHLGGLLEEAGEETKIRLGRGLGGLREQFAKHR